MLKNVSNSGRTREPIVPSVFVFVPYNKDFSKWHNRVLRWMMGNQLRHLALWLDDKLKYGERKTATWWWNRT